MNKDDLLIYLILTPAALTFPLVLIYQVYTYLKNGFWVSISALDFLKYVNLQWASNPIDWKGLADVLDVVPMSLSPIIFIIIPCLFIVSINR